MWLLLACVTASPLVGETLTEDGTWRLTLGDTRYDQGTATVRLTAVEAEAALPASGLRIFARPGMDDMDHLLEVSDFVEGDAGFYSADLLFDMTGLWTLTGYAGDDLRTESFDFVVEVTP